MDEAVFVDGVICIFFSAFCFSVFLKGLEGFFEGGGTGEVELEKGGSEIKGESREIVIESEKSEI